MAETFKPFSLASLLKQLPTCKLYSTITKEQDEEAWLRARTAGIGGSDVGPICGVSPFTSARQIYLSKTGQYEDALNPNEAAKERMYFGTLLEPVVAAEFAKRTGLRIVDIKASLINKEMPWAIANIDRLVVDETGKPLGILECKTTSEYMNDEWESGDILMSYIYQLNWYFWVMGLDTGWFACLVGGNKFYHYQVFRNDDLLNQIIIPAAYKFWHENVLALKEPEMQSVDTEFANSFYADVDKNSELVMDDDITNDLANTVFECKAKIKEITAIMEEAQNRIKDRLGRHEIGYTKDFTVKWSPRSQVRVDTDKLKKIFPEIYAQCQKTISFRAMSVRGVK